MDLSILTPAIPLRLGQVQLLSTAIEDQIGERAVEHLVLLDNKRRTVGEKRDALLRMARGKYVAFVDDDDDISHDYVALILQKVRLNPDVITFRQSATVNGVTCEIEFHLGHPNEGFPSLSAIRNPQSAIKRNAWHVCAWRRSLAIMSHFPASNYGEDWAYAKPLCEIAKTSQHIPKVLHYYRHSTETTAAPPPGLLTHA